MSKFTPRKLLIYFIIVLFIFLIDRATKIYILSISENYGEVNIFVNSYLNFILVWNTGIGFGLLSLESNFAYHFLTVIIGVINIALIILLIKSRSINSYLIALVIGGSLGNLFDRIYYYAVPDFIDFHIGNFHWFIFNVADIFITVGIISFIFIELFKKESVSKNV